MRAASVRDANHWSRLFRRFWSDETGNIVIIAAFTMPVLVGTAGLGTEYGLWVYKQHAMLSAADSSALSAAMAGTNIIVEGQGVAGSYGFVNGLNSTTVAVNQPPTSGTHTTTPGAVEVVITQSRPRLLSALFGSTPITISARAVAVPRTTGSGCVLALDARASGAVTMQGSTQVDLEECGLYDDSASYTAMSTGGTLSAQSVNVVGGISGGTGGISATDGINTGVLPLADPYADVSMPSIFSGCNQTNFSAQTTITINPGVYCGGMSVNAGAVLTLNPGIYYLNQGSFFVRGGATVTGTGVTLVFTSSTGQNWATATINGNATVNLSAPTSGPMQGIVMFGDRAMPTGTAFKLNGGSSQTFGGAIYLPKAALTYTGSSASSNGCTQIIADTITFSGNSSVENECSSYGTRNFGARTVSLVE